MSCEATYVIKGFVPADDTVWRCQNDPCDGKVHREWIHEWTDEGLVKP